MQVQNFVRTSNFSAMFSSKAPFKLNGCDSFATYQSCTPGSFCDQPADYPACAPGFRFFKRDADGVVVALKLD